MDIRFFTLSEVLRIHEQQVLLYGGDHGLRDEGLLLSAISMPLSTFGGEYLHPGIAEMAAAYLFHIVKNHPFIDGNKRTGASVAATFVLFNGYELTASSKEYEIFVWQVAAGELSKEDITVAFKRWVTAEHRA